MPWSVSENRSSSSRDDEAHIIHTPVFVRPGSWALTNAAWKGYGKMYVKAGVKYPANPVKAQSPVAAAVSRRTSFPWQELDGGTREAIGDACGHLAKQAPVLRLVRRLTSAATGFGSCSRLR